MDVMYLMIENIQHINKSLKMKRRSNWCSKQKITCGRVIHQKHKKNEREQQQEQRRTRRRDNYSARSSP
jgi:hypothetical protein